MIYDVVKREWDQALILSLDGLECSHSISFPGSRLPIHKKRRMIALENII